MNNEVELIKKQIIENIQMLIGHNKLHEAMVLIDEYFKMNSKDAEIYSIKSIVFIMQKKMNEAEKVLKEGLVIHNENFDLNYNLAYLYEQGQKFDYAVKYYKKALKNCKDENIKPDIISIIKKILSKHNIVAVKDKKKIAFFVKQGMDSFLGDIINGLSEQYETKKIIVSEYNQIDDGMKWADICWFEWCDELVAYGSKHNLAVEKKIICRLHRYEAFANYTENVKWENVNKLIFVSEHIRDVVIEKTNLPKDKCEVVYNGINLNKFKYHERKKGFNLAYIGYLNLRKNPMLIIQYFNELIKKDKRYKLFIAGSFQDETLYYYMKDIINRLGLNNNIQFDGFIPNDKMSDWLEDKSYIVTGSIAEGHPVGVMEAMASGLKPVIHYFPGSEEFYPKEYLYYELDNFKSCIFENKYDSIEYRNFIEKKYSLDRQITSIRKALLELDSVKTFDMDKGELPLVSVCIPVYNGEKYIRYTIDSVLNQTYKNLEIIISDNCSTDNTVDIVKSYPDKRIKLYENKSNIGMRANHMKCIELSNGQYIKYLFADDIINKKCIEEMVLVMEKNQDVDLCSVNFSHINQDNEIVSKPVLNMMHGKYESNSIFKQLIINGNVIGCPSGAMMRKKVFNKDKNFLFSQDIRYMGDYDLWIKICKESSYYFINKEYMYFRVHTESMSGAEISKIGRVHDFYYILNSYIDSEIFTEDERRQAYINANHRSYYTLHTNNNINEKVEIRDYILSNSRYIPKDERKQLLELKF